ncbi:MAG: hypothetical protein EBR82_31990 [Caulobacteraceae bacterium]|nr:hypothetical protein [Caulobacteraceae bacterium]
MSNASTIVKFAALLTGAAVSLLAGYVSVTGLHALFPAGGVVVLAMGAAMEVGKVVAVACWRHTAGPLRAGLAALILLLTSITAIGVYGFLSSAHLTDQVPGIAAAAQADRYAAELSIARAEQAQAEARLQRLDAAVDALPAEWVTRRQALRQSQATERAEVQAALTGSMASQRRIIEAEATARTAQATAGASPLRYAAAALGLDDEQAARLVILLLLLAFDPLGLALVAMGSGPGRQERQAPALVTAPVVMLERAARKGGAKRYGLGRGLASIIADQEAAKSDTRPQLRVVNS